MKSVSQTGIGVVVRSQIGGVFVWRLGGRDSRTVDEPTNQEEDVNVLSTIRASLSLTESWESEVRVPKDLRHGLVGSDRRWSADCNSCVYQPCVVNQPHIMAGHFSRRKLILRIIFVLEKV